MRRSNLTRRSPRPLRFDTRGGALWYHSPHAPGGAPSIEGTMDVHVWDTPIRATWHKSNSLVDLKYAPDSIELLLHEEGTRLRWKVIFKDIAGVKIIIGENAQWSQQPLPQDAGFFQITESPWLAALGLTETNDQEHPRHYVVCCRREMIEVAARDVAFATE